MEVLFGSPFVRERWKEWEEWEEWEGKRVTCSIGIWSQKPPASFSSSKSVNRPFLILCVLWIETGQHTTTYISCPTKVEWCGLRSGHKQSKLQTQRKTRKSSVFCHCTETQYSGPQKIACSYDHWGTVSFTCCDVSVQQEPPLPHLIIRQNPRG